MNPLPKYDFPWDLITDSFLGNLSTEGELKFQQWLSSNPENNKKYSKLKELWDNGMEDYKFYQMANEKKAWNSLQTKLNSKNGVKVIQAQFTQRRKLIRNIVSIAAVLIILVGFGFLFIVLLRNPVIYETANNEQKQIKLSDGSVIILKAQTKIEVSQAYNKKNRTLTMESGEASFEIVHMADKPFTVELGILQVKDIGTVFTIQKGKEKVKVSVNAGKVDFINIETKETKELSAGMSLTYNISNKSFEEIELYNSASGKNKSILDFENTSLYNVVNSLNIVYDKKIQISDSITGEKKLTAHLNGIPLDTAMEIICKSLNLELFVKDSIYLLKKKNGK